MGTENLGLAPETPFFHRVRTLYDETHCTASDNHAVPGSVERLGPFFNGFLDRCRTEREEAGTDKLKLRIGCGVFPSDDDDTVAPPHTNPVFRDGDSLCCRRTGRVDLCVRPPCADKLREVGRPEGDDLYQKVAVKLVRSFLYFPFHVEEPFGNLFLDGGLRHIFHYVIVDLLKFRVRRPDETFVVVVGDLFY